MYNFADRGVSAVLKIKELLSSCPECLRREVLREFGYCDGIVLDVGCGTGGPTKMLEKRTGYIVGVDISNCFDKSKVSAKLDFVLGDATRLPFRDESFDAVVSFDVIEHIQNDLEFLCEIKRVMKKGAMLLLETPNRNRLSMILKGLFKPIKYPMVLGPNCAHIREYLREELEKLLLLLGFRKVKIKGVWLRLRGIFEMGIGRFLRFLEKYSQCLLVKAIK